MISPHNGAEESVLINSRSKNRLHSKINTSNTAINNVRTAQSVLSVLREQVTNS